MNQASDQIARQHHHIRFVNGSVFTGERSHPWADAVLLAGARVALVGTLDEIRAAAPDAAEIDLAGRTLLPGFVDAHNHFLSTGETLGFIGLQSLGPTSRADLLRLVSDAAAETAADDVITLAGLDPAKIVGGLPERHELDAAAPGRRVIAYHVSGHGVLVNSTVLADAGVDDSVDDPVGGSFVRDGSGRLTGLCFDAAMQLIVPAAVDVHGHGPNFHTKSTSDELAKAIQRSQQAFIRAGLTSVCDAQVTAREMAAYREADARGDLLLRTVCMPLSHQLSDFEAIGIAGPFGGDRLRLGHMKFYADGTLIGHTALCCAPYGPTGAENGYLFRSEGELTNDIGEAYRLGWRVGVHAQGDKAIATVLDAIESADRIYPREDRRPRIEHAGLPTPAQIIRMAKMGVITVNQPSYLFELGDQFISDFGPRVHELQPLRDELRGGVRVVLSSDSDVASFRPLDTVSAAMSRVTMTGRPIGAEQTLTLEEALFAHSIDAAFAIGCESDVGSLEPGKAADITIIDGDLRRTSPEEIRSLEIWATLINGVVRHGPRLPTPPSPDPVPTPLS